MLFCCWAFYAAENFFLIDCESSIITVYYIGIIIADRTPCPQKFVVSSGISGPQTIEFKSHASLGYTSSSQPGLASMGMGLEAGVRIRPQAAGSWNGTRGWSRNRGARLSKGHPINSCLHTWDQCIENKDTGATPPQATGGLLWNNTPNYTPVLDPLQWMKATEPKST